MSVGLFHDARFLDHRTDRGHPERPDRLRAVERELRAEGLWDELAHPSFAAADAETIATVHAPNHAERVRLAAAEGRPFMDSPDTPICGDSYDVALLATGAALTAVDAVMAGDLRRAFCAIRPPGHHAEVDRCMGFCLFNHIALAAERLRRVHGVERVAIVDFDVHHGNGTQHLFEDRADVLFISMHEHPDYQYPGTGYAHETGRGEGEGYTVNIPLRPGSGHDEAVAAFEKQVLPALSDYQPGFLLISSGFDADEADPLGHLNFTAATYRWMTGQLVGFAEGCCEGRVVSLLEGGYDLDALGRDASAHVAALEG